MLTLNRLLGRKPKRDDHRPSWQKTTPRRRRTLRRLPVVITRPMHDSANPAVGLLRFVAALRLPRVQVRMEPRHALAIGWVMVVAVVSFELFVGSSLFYIYDVQVSGNERVQKEVIYAATSVDRQNIFWINPAGVATNISQVPGIGAVNVHLRLPNQISIAVEEHAPLVSWRRGADVKWVSAGGSGVPAVGPAPALTLTDPGGAAGDADGTLRSRILSDLQEIHRQFPGVTDLYYGAQEGIYYRSPEGYTVYLGLQGDIDQKLTLLGELVRKANGGAISFREVDLRTGRAILR